LEGAIEMTRKTLIAFFSRAGENYGGSGMVDLPVGNTEAAAKTIQKLTGGDTFKISAVKDYPAGYNETTDVARKELRQNARPALSRTLDTIGDYEVIILGYPNWWGTMPMPVFTFLERHDLSGKTIVPFCTHEGSGLGRSQDDIAKACPGAKVLKGIAIRGSEVQKAEGDLEAWLRKSGVIE
jgi:flavodoxin